jgi:hypothetical protein
MPYSNDDFLDQLRRYGVSYLVTYSLNHDRKLAQLPAFQRVVTHGTVSLWRLATPGRIVQGAQPLTLGEIRQAQDALDVTLDNPVADNPVTLTYNAYPNWNATWNGAPLTWTETKESFMQVKLPKGKGTLAWRYAWYPVERICDWVASFAWLTVLFLAYRWRRRAAAADAPV